MKLLALTQRVELVGKYKEKRDCLDQKWIDFVMSCGFIPLVLPNNLSVVKQLVSEFNISGIVLTGGNNLTKYGGDAQERDDAEKFLMDFAIERDLPLLGVCRGMQVIQDFFGVSLENVEGHVAVNHKLFINEKEVLINSYHSFGSKKSVDKLLVKARSEDGVIEAIQHRSKKIYGIMWHPERNGSFEEFDIKFINKIFGK